MNKYFNPILILFAIIILAAFLRLYEVDSNPPGLYIDEVSIGYNAYTILTKGVDEYGVPYPLWFKSFGDYKMPVYIYAVSGAMALFGKTELAVRLPSVVAGVMTVVVLYFFIRGFEKKDDKRGQYAFLALLSAFLLSISSYHIQFSRGGFEVNLALFIFLSGCLFLQYFLRHQQKRYLAASLCLFVLSSYTYHSFRVLAPIAIFTGLILLNTTRSLARKEIFLSGIGSLMLFLPLIIFSLSPNGSQRFSQTSIFSEYPLTNEWAKLYTYPLVLLKNYVSYFSLHFLFSFGDGIGRHQVPGFGLLFRTQLPLLIAGITTLIKMRKTMLARVMLFLLLVAPIPAMLARPSPHSLRPLLLVIPLTVIMAMGLRYLLTGFGRWGRGVVVILACIFVYEFSFYLFSYYVRYPQINALDWGAGYKEIVQKAREHRDEYPRIVIDKKLDNALIYFKFYDESLDPILVGNDWKFPVGVSGAKTMYIRPNYGNVSENVFDTVKLPGKYGDTFAQFWRESR